METLKVLHLGYLEVNKRGNLKDFKHYVEDFFKVEADENGKKIDYSTFVRLSSIHKAKGLEANRVFIDRPDLLPFPFAREGWQTEQEYNILYVALTRAKEALYFIGQEPVWNHLAPPDCTLEQPVIDTNERTNTVPKVSPRYDIKSLIERYASIQVVSDAVVCGVREYHSNCPWCGGTDRFITRPETGQYTCAIRSSGCGRTGDCLDFLKDYCDMTYFEACAELGLDADSPDWTAASYDEASRDAPPSKKWQETGMLIVERAERFLWHPRSPDGQQALAYLRGRGLSDEIIRKKRYGYCPLGKDGRWYMGSFEEWGIDPDTLTEAQREKGGVRVPNGIIIPWFCQGQLWKIAVKRPGEKMDYGQVLGSGEGLYNVDAIQFDQPVMMVEGEFDQASVEQEAGDLIACVATGSSSRGRTGRWIGELSLASYVLQSFDRDKMDPDTGERSGDQGAQYWLDVLSNCTRWCPWADEWGEKLRFKDPNEMLQYAEDFKLFTGLTLREWVETGIAATESPPSEDPDDVDGQEDINISLPDDSPSEQDEKADSDESEQRLEQFASTVAEMASIFGGATVVKHEPGLTLAEYVKSIRSPYAPVTLLPLPRKECPHEVLYFGADKQGGHTHMQSTPCKGIPLAHGWCAEHQRSHDLLCLMASLGFPEVELTFQTGYQNGKPVVASRIIGEGVANCETYAECAPEKWLARDIPRIRSMFSTSLRLVS